MVLQSLDHNDSMYALALQFEDYRGACRHAIRGIRRARRMDRASTDIWVLRLQESFRRRNG